MFEPLIRIPVVIGAGVLWFAGLRLFLQSDLSRTRKARWTTILVIVGIGTGVVLSLSELWAKFFLLIVILPVIALADLLLFRSQRGLSFWIRACGFEVGTVFGVAAVSRFLLDLAGVAAWVRTVN